MNGANLRRVWDAACRVCRVRQPENRPPSADTTAPTVLKLVHRLRLEPHQKSTHTTCAMNRLRKIQSPDVIVAALAPAPDLPVPDHVPPS